MPWTNQEIQEIFLRNQLYFFHWEKRKGEFPPVTEETKLHTASDVCVCVKSEAGQDHPRVVRVGVDLEDIQFHPVPTKSPIPIGWGIFT